MGHLNHYQQMDRVRGVSDLENQKLFVGIDLCNDYTQITCYDERIYEPVPVGNDFGDEEYHRIPTMVARKENSRDWIYGEEANAAMEASASMETNASTETLVSMEKGDTVVAKDILTHIQSGEPYVIWGEETAPEFLLEKFLRFILRLLKKDYPNDTIKKLVITVEEKQPELLAAIYGGLEKLGLHKDRVAVFGHRQSYMYYALSQNRELWMNDVGLFEYTQKGLRYYQISIDRRSERLIAGVREKECSDTLTYDFLQEEEPAVIKQAFLNVAGTLLHRQLVSTLYVTGEGFEHEFAKEALVELCTGRRVFKGQNLYTKGACYAARELSGEGKLSDCIFLDEEMVESNVSIRIYKDAKMDDMVLVKAGTPWYDVDEEIQFIPDDEDEILLTTQNVMKRERKSHLLSLIGIVGRENRMTRFSLRIRFADAGTCIVTLKDLGFGSYVATSNRIWERTIAL